MVGHQNYRPVQRFLSAVLRVDGMAQLLIDKLGIDGQLSASAYGFIGNAAIDYGAINGGLVMLNEAG